MKQRPCIIRLDMDNLDHDVSNNVRFIELVEQGWKPIAPLAVESKGVVQLALIMAPPNKRINWRRLMLRGVMIGTTAAITTTIMLSLWLQSYQW